jgi:Protein of unknown function (DUF2599)
MRPTWRARGRWDKETWERIFADLKDCMPFPDLTDGEMQSVYEQLACHSKWGVADLVGGPTWDFETERPTKGLDEAVGGLRPPGHKCNW